MILNEDFFPCTPNTFVGSMFSFSATVYWFSDLAKCFSCRVCFGGGSMKLCFVVVVVVAIIMILLYSIECVISNLNYKVSDNKLIIIITHSLILPFNQQGSITCNISLCYLRNLFLIFCELLLRTLKLFQS